MDEPEINEAYSGSMRNGVVFTTFYIGSDPIKGKVIGRVWSNKNLDPPFDWQPYERGFLGLPMGLGLHSYQSNGIVSVTDFSGRPLDVPAGHISLIDLVREELKARIRLALQKNPNFLEKLP
ncbi:hypothetical protein HYV81_05835 [Candidatus Woesearchaeota archaeon]|nr:hypothetical protein [Candidatus Woesearchaeota archaeon]